MKKIRILIADDHALLRIGLITMLSNTQPDMSVVGEAENGVKAVEITAKTKPDVVIMDLMMPKMNGAEATRRICELLPETKIIVLTSYGTSDELRQALEYGAMGVQLKGSPVESLIDAIREVASGNRAIAPELRGLLEDGNPPDELSKRQREVLSAAAAGLTTEQIADRLGISPATVKLHVAAACERLGAASRAEAIAIALKKHLLKI